MEKVYDVVLLYFNPPECAVISALHRQHRAAEFKKFLIRIDEEMPGHLQIHLIVDTTAPTRLPGPRVA
ncbi:hypothetical protein [Streptomyces sp. NPDC003006]